MPLALRVSGSGEWNRANLSLKSKSNWLRSSSVRCVSCTASRARFLSLMSWGMCIHLFMSLDFLPLMLREAR